MSEQIPWALVPWGLLIICLIDAGTVVLDRRQTAREKLQLLFQERFVYPAATTALSFYLENKQAFAIVLPIFAFLVGMRMWKSVRSR